jgi:ectoine hydroxylase-related dioxygenase (phytanoyl-CoA dioxygenase family)
MVLDSVLDPGMLDFIRQYCDRAVLETESRMRAEGKTQDGINLLGSRYFISHFTRQYPPLFRAIFNDTMAEICRQTIGPDAYLHNEQFVVKLSGEEGKFAWHQDGGYTIDKGEGAPHRPYVTCWIPLDDVSDANGTVRILPYSRAGTRDQARVG